MERFHHPFFSKKVTYVNSKAQINVMYEIYDEYLIPWPNFVLI